MKSEIIYYFYLHVYQKPHYTNHYKSTQSFQKAQQMYKARPIESIQNITGDRIQRIKYNIHPRIPEDSIVTKFLWPNFYTTER